MADIDAKERSFVNPIHGVWAIAGVAAVAAARWYLPRIPEEILVCPSRSLLGIRCVGCGSGSALVALSRFQIIEAVKANPLFVIGGFAFVIWSLVATIGYSIGKPLKKWAITDKRKKAQRWGLIAVLAINWIYEITAF